VLGLFYQRFEQDLHLELCQVHTDTHVRPGAQAQVARSNFGLRRKIGVFIATLVSVGRGVHDHYPLASWNENVITGIVSNSEARKRACNRAVPDTLQHGVGNERRVGPQSLPLVWRSREVEQEISFGVDCRVKTGDDECPQCPACFGLGEPPLADRFEQSGRP